MDLEAWRAALRSWFRQQRIEQRRRRDRFRRWRSDKWEVLRRNRAYRRLRGLLARFRSFGLLQWVILLGVLIVTAGSVAVLGGTTTMLTLGYDANEPRSIVAAGTLLIVEGVVLVTGASMILDQLS